MNFDNITKFLDSLQQEGIPSVDCAIYQDHKLLYRHMNGFTDAEQTKAIQGDELYLMFSMTKVQTMVAIMQLVERGLVSLEDSVSKYLPAYASLTVEQEGVVKPVETEMKIKHLVSMQSGLDYNLDRPGIRRVLSERGAEASTGELVNAFVESPLKFVPGEHFEYSLSHDVVAAVIEVVSGMKFSEYLKKNIWEPLHMKRTYFAKPMNYEDKLAAQFEYDNENRVSNLMPSSCNYQLSENYESGGAGLISCLEDYAIFADTIACGGISAEGVRIIKPETIDLMRTDLLNDITRLDIEQKMGRVGYGYGCGVQILVDPHRANAKAPAGIFGWDGAAGSCIIMDKENKLSLVYTQHVRNCGMAYGYIHPTLRDLMYE